MARERRSRLTSIVFTLFRDAVRGDRSALASLASMDLDELYAAARHHGVLPLVADRLRTAGLPETPVTRAIAEAASEHAALDLLRERGLRGLLEALDRSDVRVVVVKGEQLAYSLYPRPDLRARADTDLLIAQHDRDRAHQVLLNYGYEPPRQVSGDFVTHQAIYTLRRGSLPIHLVDLHWRLTNPHLFAGVLTFEDAWTDAVALPRLSPAARGLSAPHALLLACVHRVAHHFDSDCVIWLYDIHLIAETMTHDEWRKWLALVESGGVVTVCRRGLEAASHAFGTLVPSFVTDDPRLVAEGHPDEPTAAYLSAHRRPVDNFVADLRALPRWGDRLRLTLEHAFPSPQYMHEVYAPTSRAPLAVLYARRVLRGARKWLVRA